MVFKNVLRIILYGLGLGSISALVYLAGPFIAFGDVRPLENSTVREVVIVLILAAVASAAGAKGLLRWRGAARVATGIGSAAESDDSDAPVLKDKMKDALATLKTAAGGRSTYLYDLPWYVIIGPPGAGKTTALVNSGLKFPLARDARPSAIAGVGGTRYCDWWFTEDAVLIDTAGRYTTQDSDGKTDQKSWFAFLDTLKKGRPRQPINGVMVAISVEDLLTLGSTDLLAHANAIRGRLLELHTRLKVDFPVYALFTKTDLILGFTEYFQNLGEQGRRQVFGATFQTDDKTKNLVNSVPDEFDTLVERLNEEMPDRLQEEPDPVSRVQSYGFPTQLEALKRPLFDFLNQIFEPTRYHANATLRGFYFTSGTQQGTPIDQLIGALEKSFGAVEVASSAYSGGGKSYFLTDLIKKVIIGEAAWVSTDRGAVRRAAILKACAFAGLIALTAGLAGLWWISYGGNSALIENTQTDVADYKKDSGDLSRQTTIADHDFIQVIQPLDTLLNLPAGYAVRDVSVPVSQTFGLGQHDRLQSSAVESYHNGLERLFRPRLIYRLEEVLDERRNDTSFVYNALKVYMMLGHRAPTTDKALILDWFHRDWADNLYQAQGNEAGRQALERHLAAMLDLDDGEKPLFELSRTLLDSAQGSLAQLSVARRAYELLKEQASASGKRPDWSLVKQGSLQASSVFEPSGPESLSSIHVPSFYTYAGFHYAVLGQLRNVAHQVDKENWVLGESGSQSAVQEQYITLPRDLLDIYTKDFIAAWERMLSEIKLKRFSGDKTYIALTAAASATSPVKQLIESIRNETAVTRPPAEATPKADASPAPEAEAKPGDDAPVLLQDGAPGAEIADHFKSFQDMLAGDPGSRPIDQFLQALSNITSDLKREALSPSDTPQINTDLQTKIGDLRNISASLPQPFSSMMLHAAADFDNEGVGTAITLLSRGLGEVTRSCKALVENSYPFVRGSDRDLGLVDFGRVFGPGGSLDQYFSQSLAKYVDKSRRDWVWKAADPVAKNLSLNTLHSFQRASEIREAFFASGAPQPSFMVTLTPPSITDPNVTAKLDFYGTSVLSQSGNSAPVTAYWPGGGAYQLKITVSTAAPPPVSAPTQDPVTMKPAVAPSPPTQPDVSTLVNKTGVWSLFRLLDEAGGNLVKYYSGGQYYSYRFAATSAANPLNLNALRQFRCPANI